MYIPAPAERLRAFADSVHRLSHLLLSRRVVYVVLPGLRGRARLCAIEHSCIAYRTPHSGYSWVACRRILGGANGRVSKREMSA